MDYSKKFHYPPKVDFTKSPLEEAWLVIKWKLDTVSQSPQMLRDELFPLALGRFDHIVKGRYKFRTELPANQAPVEITPYIGRFQFRQQGPDGWPLLQIGPGIATVNFRSPCSWEDFLQEALFLRKAIIDAYSEKVVVIDSLTLTYRNGVKFNYNKEDLFKFLSASLNVNIEFPKYVPGALAKRAITKNFNTSVAFDLTEPTDSTGTLKIATGLKKEKLAEEEYVIFDIEVDSNKTLPEISNKKAFTDWLSQSHAVCHEWFMALIEGNLLEHFTEDKD